LIDSRFQEGQSGYATSSFLSFSLRFNFLVALSSLFTKS